jgi:hypothetical protein
MKMKNLEKAHYVFILGFLMLIGCDSGQEQIQTLTQEHDELRENYQNQLQETRIVTKSADSLQTIVHRLQSEVERMKGDMPTYNATSEDEKAIEALVANLHRAWATMLETDDTNSLLQYFLSRYTTSAVRINTENIPTVVRNNDADFEEHLNELILANDVSLSFGQTKFLHTEVKGDIFVTSYITKVRVYQNNNQTYTGSLVTQLAGQRKEGVWKVGSYNWVNFNY